VEVFDHERKGFNHSVERRDQKGLADALNCHNALYLGDLIDRIDDVNALDPIEITLMDAIDSKVARSPLGIGLTSDANLCVFLRS